MVASIFAASGRCRIDNESRDVGGVEARDDLGIKSLEGFAEGVALAQDGQPGQAGLEAVQHELFPERAAVVLGHAPFLVVVGAEKWVILGPGAAVTRIGHGEKLGA